MSDDQGVAFAFYEKICPACGGQTTQDDEATERLGLIEDVEWCLCGWHGSTVLIRFVYGDGSMRIKGDVAINNQRLLEQ